MREYLISYRLSAGSGQERDLLVRAVNLRQAVEMAHRKLWYRYPNYQLVGGLPLDEVRVEVESRR